MTVIAEQSDKLRSQIYEMAEQSLAKVSTDAQTFLDNGFVSKVNLPLNVPVKVCEGFVATCLVKNDESDFDVVKVDYQRGFVLPKSKHKQVEAIVNIQGILSTRIWDINGKDKKIMLTDNDRLEAFNIGEFEEHDHEAIESGTFVSVLSPRVTTDEPKGLFQKIKDFLR